MDEKTREIVSIFKKISAIPRCSKNEARIAQWLHQWAQNKGYTVRTDPANNMVIDIPATKGAADRPAIVIQGHMDMVCEKTDDATHDFTQDPILPVVDGDWLIARNTSLGADNGIALAYALAVAEDPGVSHPPLELLFTVDEESGLLGAKAMATEFVSGRQLLNIDSEEEGVFTVGCAGGQDMQLVLDLAFSEIPAHQDVFRVAVCGLQGGHSGIDIHKHRASANKLMARILAQLRAAFDIRLLFVQGGTTHNAIARDAEAAFSAAAECLPDMKRLLADFQNVLRNEYAPSDPELAIAVGPHQVASSDRLALTVPDSQRVVNLLMALPHGMITMSADIEGLVETSSNLAVVSTKNHSVKVLCSQRSSVMSRLAEISERISAIAELSGAATSEQNSYPSWPPDMQSPLLERCKTVYHELYASAPEIQLIHAGLECGLIGAKHPGMDMISFGPTIENPHSPNERLYLPSVSKVWDFLVALLASYTSD